jgi:hypothetical protein
LPSSPSPLPATIDITAHEVKVEGEDVLVRVTEDL